MPQETPNNDKPRALLEALHSRCGLDVAEFSNNGEQIRMLARVSMADNWRVVMQRLKSAELQAAWSIDISQLYFLKSKHERAPLVKGWRIIIKGKDLVAACEQLAKVVRGAPSATVSVDEMPLPGGGMHRQYGDKGKGASMLSGSGASGPSMHLFRRSP